LGEKKEGKITTTTGRMMKRERKRHKIPAPRGRKGGREENLSPPLPERKKGTQRTSPTLASFRKN